ncbi:TPA: SWIM zinc finger family protein [Salmonella enterica]|nr:SWIM zinc finger family protein [Salmonella enterica]HAK8439476.1 SWIM zinc finger family protein [Salmonella enterica]
MFYQLTANSSRSSSEYTVTISDDSGELKTTCSCFAFDAGSMCRHRIALLTYRPKDIFTHKEQADAIKAAVSLAKQYDTKTAYKLFMDELSDLEKDTKRKEREIKKRLYNAL